MNHRRHLRVRVRRFAEAVIRAPLQAAFANVNLSFEMFEYISRFKQSLLLKQMEGVVSDRGRKYHSICQFSRKY